MARHGLRRRCGDGDADKRKLTPYLEVTGAGDELVASSVAEDDRGATAVLSATETTSYTLLAGPDRHSRGQAGAQMTTAQLDDNLIDLLDADRPRLPPARLRSPP